MSLIGMPGSEHGNVPRFFAHKLTGVPFKLGTTEQEIFSSIAFINYGYFYDLDKKWYYVVPGPFRIKIPIDLVKHNLDEDGYEFDFRNSIEREIVSE